jgi:hypothetical protein
LSRALVALLLVLGSGIADGASGEVVVYVPPACEAPVDIESDAALLRCFAPSFVVARVEESYNRIGAIVLERGGFGGLSVRVDPDRPVIYTEVRLDIVGGELVRQLVYRVHFEKIPFEFSLKFYEAHRNPGLLVVVTVDAAAAKPRFVTVVHTCGCYAAILPTSHVPAAALPKDRARDVVHIYGQTLPAILEVPSAGARLRLSLEAGSHRATDVRFDTAPPSGRVIPIEFRPIADLRDMPVLGGSDGERASAFHDTWPARGHLRGAWNPFEGLTLWGIVALDPMVGMDKDLGDPAQTGTAFYTMLTPWLQSASRLDRFDRLLRELGYRTDTLW